MSSLTEDQARLADAMSGISEDTWCAGWLTGLEYDLWAMLTEGRALSYGMGGVSMEDLATVSALSAKVGGWIAWDDKVGEVFVPMVVWLVRAQTPPVWPS